MKILPTVLPEVLLIEPQLHRDERGFFLETFNSARFREAGLPTVFAQDNHSRSGHQVLRGLHYQLRHPQGKLVTAVRGRVFDVAVDIRRGSPRFGKWTAHVLDGENPQFLYIPEGFAHGFCVLSESADFLYKCTAPYDGSDDCGVSWNDPSLGIPWPVPSPKVSTKDARYQPLDLKREDLPVWRNGN